MKIRTSEPMFSQGAMPSTGLGSALHGFAFPLTNDDDVYFLGTISKNFYYSEHKLFTEMMEIEGFNIALTVVTSCCGVRVRTNECCAENRVRHLNVDGLEIEPASLVLDSIPTSPLELQNSAQIEDCLNRVYGYEGIVVWNLFQSEFFHVLADRSNGWWAEFADWPVVS